MSIFFSVLTHFCRRAKIVRNSKGLTPPQVSTVVNGNVPEEIKVIKQAPPDSFSTGISDSS